ncbi:MAG: hypothetical protein A3B31_01675 [Candidatus Komeilibacteria bacterium RIFCSPLOWO2_01_FULL_53_11]|uniref:Ribosomal RNA large subunit methyltransferase K/L-like methyltransferase domain-containing protein n=1 Tax=Candidatus Komeilibacteria bacterium RIFCSPLOWO2_01_FULL_53_11 TaxID=1798552 RepID=A0A1G2BUV9_9BACT|nr:MAG: hypothetical protein A3B31_01675 [Candidatus Komeilibacteria bacterium RIFCSPLOWO2_01_FULL_53_11]
MEAYIFILGRSPALSIEELLVVLKPLGHIVEITNDFLVFQGVIDPVALLSRLGGTIKIARVEHTCDQWKDISFDLCLRSMRSELQGQQVKFNFGISVYGADEAYAHLNALGLQLKKHLRHIGYKVRLVTSRDCQLSSVIVQKNNLLKREIVVAQGKRCYLGVTEAVQDFDSYSRRDYGRPSRNAQRGMLPPKLAQIMLNLASVTTEAKLLDPFCGGGTIVQEALLLGVRSVYGSDKDPTAIAEAEQNISWLREHFGARRPQLQRASIAEVRRTFPGLCFDVIVTEPYLGPARLLMKYRLMRSDFDAALREVRHLYRELFKVAVDATGPLARMVVVFPVYNLFNREYPVGNLEEFESFGWRLVRPAVQQYMPSLDVSPRGLLYYSRPDQVVRREITVWQKR